MYGISETHLKDNEAIELDGYKWIGCNRRILSNKAWRGSGGIGFLIKNCILDNFDVDILDNSRDDILWINLKCKHDQNFMLYLCVCVTCNRNGQVGATLLRNFTTIFYRKCIFIVAIIQS